MELLPDLPLVHLRFAYRFMAETRLPRWKGALLRGGWGRALSKVFCIPTCENVSDCQVACPYRNLFAPEAPQNQLVGVREAPRPFIVRPPLDEQTQFSIGDRLSFDLILIGSAERHVIPIIAAFEHLGRLGLGEDRAMAELSQVDSFSSQRQQFIPLLKDGQWFGMAAQLQPQFFLDHAQRFESRWQLQFVTPTRLKQQGQLARQFDLPLIVGAALRRIQQMNSLYGTKPWNCDLDRLFNQARAAQFEAAHTRWVEWGRTSAATGQNMQFGGVVGTIDFSRITPELTALLLMASALHIGKAAVFGNGWFRLR
ncbi:MAG: CRISPR system precrRNA processing endoribonuclease RAMP protein Cas6 [Chloroflexi bacterium]|nr:CRISPR system precrRNA processing endoribonuclease RAMP protein Cas6 [Chloroflexota bacterium]